MTRSLPSRRYAPLYHVMDVHKAHAIFTGDTIPARFKHFDPVAGNWSQATPSPATPACRSARRTASGSRWTRRRSADAAALSRSMLMPPANATFVSLARTATSTGKSLRTTGTPTTSIRGRSTDPRAAGGSNGPRSSCNLSTIGSGSSTLLPSHVLAGLGTAGATGLFYPECFVWRGRSRQAHGFPRV
jgi:hypothetical protein